MTPFRAARATAAEAAGSRRCLTFTKFARSNHDRSASVNLLVIAPPEPFHGESKINTPPHTHSVKAFEGVTTRQSRVGRICQRQISPRERECRFATSPNWRIAPILFSKSSLWRSQGAEPLASSAPRYLHPDKPKFERHKHFAEAPPLCHGTAGEFRSFIIFQPTSSSPRRRCRARVARADRGGPCRRR